jgi:hypothetical protein
VRVKSTLFAFFVLTAAAATAQQNGPDISIQFPSGATQGELDHWVSSINSQDGVLLMNRTEDGSSNEIHASFSMTKQSLGFIVGQYSYQFTIHVDIVNGVAALQFTLNRPTVIGIVLDSDIRGLFARLSDSLKSAIADKEPQK